MAVVCLGNICRSPIAEVVLTAELAHAGLDGEVEVVSAGTGDWHVGDPMDRRAAAVLDARGYDSSRHRAFQVSPAWLDECDLVLAMDAVNHADLLALGGDDRLRMFRDFDPALPPSHAPDADRDVPDPYYGGDEGFDRVLTVIERTARSLVAALAARTGREPAGGADPRS